MIANRMDTTPSWIPAVALGYGYMDFWKKNLLYTGMILTVVQYTRMENTTIHGYIGPNRCRPKSEYWLKAVVVFVFLL